MSGVNQQQPSSSQVTSNLLHQPPSLIDNRNELTFNNEHLSDNLITLNSVEKMQGNTGRESIQEDASLGSFTNQVTEPYSQMPPKTQAHQFMAPSEAQPTERSYLEKNLLTNPSANTCDPKESNLQAVLSPRTQNWALSTAQTNQSLVNRMRGEDEGLQLNLRNYVDRYLNMENTNTMPVQSSQGQRVASEEQQLEHDRKYSLPSNHQNESTSHDNHMNHIAMFSQEHMVATERHEKSSVLSPDKFAMQGQMHLGENSGPAEDLSPNSGDNVNLDHHNIKQFQPNVNKALFSESQQLQDSMNSTGALKSSHGISVRDLKRRSNSKSKRPLHFKSPQPQSMLERKKIHPNRRSDSKQRPTILEKLISITQKNGQQTLGPEQATEGTPVKLMKAKSSTNLNSNKSGRNVGLDTKKVVGSFNLTQKTNRPMTPIRLTLARNVQVADNLSQASSNRQTQKLQSRNMLNNFQSKTATSRTRKKDRSFSNNSSLSQTRRKPNENTTCVFRGGGISAVMTPINKKFAPSFASSHSIQANSKCYNAETKIKQCEKSI